MEHRARKATIAAIMLIAFPSLAHAGGLPLGLDELHWGMSYQAAKRVLPEIQPGTDTHIWPIIAGQGSGHINFYPYSGCEFTVRLDFDPRPSIGLETVEFYKTAPHSDVPCGAKIEAALAKAGPVEIRGGAPQFIQYSPGPPMTIILLSQQIRPVLPFVGTIIDVQNPIDPHEADDGQLFAAARAVDMEKPLPVEPMQRAERKPRAAGDNDGVFLFLADGTRSDFRNSVQGCATKDQPLDDGRCQRFYLAADLPSRHFFVVRRQDYEGGAWLLVDDRSGRRIELDSAPVGFSQDGQRFLVLNDDVADDHKNNIEIWRREGEGAVLEWAYSVEQQKKQVPFGLTAYTSEMMHWQGDHMTLSFRQSGWFDTKTRRKVPDRYWTGSLTRTDGDWRLQADWPNAPR